MKYGKRKISSGVVGCLFFLVATMLVISAGMVITITGYEFPKFEEPVDDNKDDKRRRR